MTTRTIGLATCVWAMCANTAAFAQLPELRFERGGLDISVRGVLSGQAAVFDDGVPGGRSSGTGYDASVRVNAEWVTDSGLLFGAYVDQGRISRETEVLQTGEAYGFVSSDFGRIEVGLQDGGNDQLAFKAPVVGLGQVRGDFSRYAGTQALLVAPDTADAFKIVYLSPPVAGFRAGISWAPKSRRNMDEPNPRNRTILENTIEAGANYQTPVGEWVLGVSGGYVYGRAAVETERQDLKAWNIGIDARRGPLRIGGSYVDRGDSNRRNAGFNQREISGGVAWVTPEWSVSASAARSTATLQNNQTYGVGGTYRLTRNIQLRADVVHFREQRGIARTNGVVGLMELALLF